MRTVPAWEEYLSTGMDPTGGELEEAAPPKSYQPKTQKPSREANLHTAKQEAMKNRDAFQ